MDLIDTQLSAWFAEFWTSKLALFLAGALVAVIAVRVLQGLASRSIRDTASRYRVRKFIGFVGYLLVALILLSSLSERIGQFSVVFGVAGAGIAFSLQEVIASIAGWIAIQFGGFYRPGDRVQLGGIKGDVIDIGMLRTTLMEIGDWISGDIYNGRVVRVANSFVFKEPVYNYSGEFAFLWDEFTLPVRFGSDWRLASKLIVEAVEAEVGEYTEGARRNWAVMVNRFLIEDAAVEPRVTVMITDNWIAFTARYVVDYRVRRKVKSAIMERLLIAFEEHKDQVRFASTTVELVAAPPLRFGDSYDPIAAKRDYRP
ncbi:MAG: mechanosensitive ion channel [Novosphingobium sp.]|uniref:mechanosensitive ion channel family protein n=1 Tax=Novosphingobium sp. TaxID=1874826 RepID=UPI001DE04343|nr:mechanosensitive ion channel domain-containing protein [Novosphingobium sp.]MCB2057308.1 mechanosensitive ion channel [Novosphingobium sp.]MCP5385700.1 mechanosensitive ion channel [Novosphingobium sp.]